MKIICSICLELCTHDTVSVAGECGHCFHTACLQSWFERKSPNCPQCRRPSKKPIKLFIEDADAGQANFHTEFNSILDENEKLKEENARAMQNLKAVSQNARIEIAEAGKQVAILQSEINVLRSVEVQSPSPQVYQQQQPTYQEIRMPNANQHQQNHQEIIITNANQPWLYQSRPTTFPEYQMGHIHYDQPEHIHYDQPGHIHYDQPEHIHYGYQPYHRHHQRQRYQQQFQQQQQQQYGNNNYGFH